MLGYYIPQEPKIAVLEYVKSALPESDLEVAINLLAAAKITMAKMGKRVLHHPLFNG